MGRGSDETVGQAPARRGGDSSTLPKETEEEKHVRLREATIRDRGNHESLELLLGDLDWSQEDIKKEVQSLAKKRGKEQKEAFEEKACQAIVLQVEGELSDLGYSEKEIKEAVSWFRAHHWRKNYGQPVVRLIIEKAKGDLVSEEKFKKLGLRAKDARYLARQTLAGEGQRMIQETVVEKTFPEREEGYPPLSEMERYAVLRQASDIRAIITNASLGQEWGVDTYGQLTDDLPGFNEEDKWDRRSEWYPLLAARATEEYYKPKESRRRRLRNFLFSLTPARG